MLQNSFNTEDFMKTGCPMEIITLPKGFYTLSKHKNIDLSSEAQKRLKFIDWYNLESPKFSKDKKKSVSLTCRHFGLFRSYFYRWYKRFKKYGVQGLEDYSHKPKHLRKAEHDVKLVKEIEMIRREHPTYSAKKIKVILSLPISASTIGRIIKRYGFYYIGKDIKRRIKYHKKHTTNRIDITKRAKKPNEIIEFDMKHINLIAGKFYAMCSIDQYTRRVSVHISSSSKSTQAVIALQKTISKFGRQIVIHNDNGSENMGETEEFLKSQDIKQYWARPHKPKDKPYIERFIGTMQRELLNFNYRPFTVGELQVLVDKWIEEYENRRPHESLGMLTPKQFEDKFNREHSLCQSKVS